MGTLSKSQILSATDLPIEAVEVPEWGGTVHVRTLSSYERDQFEAATVKVRGRKTEPNLANLRARLACLVICDEKGKPLFDVTEDARMLGDKSSKALDRVLAVARRLNGMDDEAVEEAAKN